MQIQINNLNINFQVYGSGTPLVVLHGWGDRGDSWYNFAQLMSKQCQVFLLDLPGFGGSDPPDSVWGVDDYKKVIDSFIDELEIEKPILLGHSHGGKIASTIASEGKRIRALVLVASAGVDTRSLMVNLKILWFKTLKLVLKPFGKAGQKILQHYRQKLGSTDYQQAGQLRDTMVKVVNHKLFSILPAIKIPVLIIWGSNDKTLDMKQAKIFERLIPNSYIRIVWGATHHPQIDDPNELAKITSEFIKAL